jgi:hypothetical protein
MSCLLDEGFLPYAVELSIFIVASVCCLLLFLFLLLHPLFYRFLCKKNTIKMYYKKIYRIALDEDYYLINSFANKTADIEEFHIDHILIGDKFIYCIRDRYYDGAIKASENDERWVFYSRKYKKGTMIVNPLKMNAIRVSKMSLMSGINEKFFVSVVLVNDDCLITNYEVTSDSNFVVSLKNLPAFIASKEALPIEPMDPRSLAIAAKDIAELNLHGKK